MKKDGSQILAEMARAAYCSAWQCGDSRAPTDDALAQTAPRPSRNDVLALVAEPR